MAASPPPADAPGDVLYLHHWAMRGKRSREVTGHLDAALQRVLSALADAPAPGLDVERLHQYLHDEAVFTDEDHAWHLRVCEGVTALADQNAAPAPPTYTEVERLDRPGNRANLDARN